MMAITVVMLVIVFHGVVQMLMLVGFRQVQIDADRHERSSQRPSDAPSEGKSLCPRHSRVNHVHDPRVDVNRSPCLGPSRRVLGRSALFAPA